MSQTKGYIGYLGRTKTKVIISFISHLKPKRIPTLKLFAKRLFCSEPQWEAMCLSFNQATEIHAGPALGSRLFLGISKSIRSEGS